MMILTSSLWTRRKSYLTGILFTTIAAFLFLSCAGGADSGSTPSWLAQYPADSAYYVGIGGSDTGNLAEDREKAAAAARADLAAQISSQINSELDISTSASSEGDFSEKVERTVSESVEQNLQSVQTVDSWISPELGAWVYVRLSRAEWAAIVNREISDLTLRANEILRPVATDSMTEAEEMAALGRSRLVLLSSPWGLRVKDAVFGSGGFLLDSIDGEISDRTGSLALSASADPARSVYGRVRTLSGRLDSSSEEGTGSYPLLVKVAGLKPFNFTTERDGSYEVSLSTETLPPGTHRLEVLPSLAEWKIPESGFPVSRASVEIEVEPILLALIVDAFGADGLSDMDGAVGDWLSDLSLPAEIVSPGRGETDMTFAWTVFDYPRSDRLANAPYITQVGAVITIARDGNTLLVREVKALKDGGLDWGQAHFRAARGLLDRMGEDVELRLDLSRALGL